MADKVDKPRFLVGRRTLVVFVDGEREIRLPGSECPEAEGFPRLRDMLRSGEIVCLDPEFTAKIAADNAPYRERQRIAAQLKREAEAKGEIATEIVTRRTKVEPALAEPKVEPVLAEALKPPLFGKKKAEK